MNRQVGAFREVLPEKAVGVLVGAALPRWVPRWVGVAEVDLDAGVEAYAGMSGHLQALTRGQAFADVFRKGFLIWNQDPKPFAWTKTADEILDRLAAYVQRIPGAGH